MGKKETEKKCITQSIRFSDAGAKSLTGKVTAV